MNKKIAISIVNWNGLRFLENCLTAVYAQTYKNFDVYFVDNGSTDESISFVRDHFPQVKIFQLSKNTGFSYANNVAIHAAFKDGDVRYVLTLNNDTKMDSDCLFHLVKIIEQDEKIASVTPKIKYFNTNTIDSVGMVISRDGGAISRGYKEEDNGQYDVPVEIFGVSACSALYRREALEDIQYRDEFFDNSFFAYYEDLDLAWRLRLRGWTAWSCPQVVVMHVHSGTSIAYSPFKAYYVNRNGFFLIVKNFPIKNMVRAFLVIPYRYMKLSYNMFFKNSSPSYKLQKKTSVLFPFFLAIKGWISFVFHLFFLITKRHNIQSNRKVSLNEIMMYFDVYGTPMNNLIDR